MGVGGRREGYQRHKTCVEGSKGISGKSLRNIFKDAREEVLGPEYPMPTRASDVMAGSPGLN